MISSSANNSYFAVNKADGYTINATGTNNVFYEVTSGDVINQAAGSGVNTVYAQSNYQLGANIQNMVVNWATSGVSGNGLDNYITTAVANITIDGGAGNDVITGAAGDNFRFDANSGYDVITNFQPGARTSVATNPETVQLAGYAQFQTYAQVQAAMTQQGADVILKLDAHDAILFRNTTLANFAADNFLLAAPVNTATLTQTFDDEFNGALSASAGGLGTMWRTDYGFGADTNALLSRTLPATGEKELLVDPTMVSDATGQAVTTNPFSMGNGALNIHAAPAAPGAAASLYGYQFTSGMLNTRNSFTQTYGYFEARMKLPAGNGAWPQFWLYSATGNKSEIDIMESTSADTWTATEHDYTSGTDSKGQTTIYTPDLSAAYHTFGVLWTAKTITWYLDGVAVRSIATPASLNGPMYMVLDLALTSSTSSSFSGADMSVDYVRAYSLDSLPKTVTAAPSLPATLTDINGATTLSGTVNDTFQVSNSATKVIEAKPSAAATVYASVNYALPTNVRTLVLTGSATQATSNSVGGVLKGNDNGDTLIGGAGKDTLIGGAGNDTLRAGLSNDILTGGGGSDVFVFGATIGYDTITDFDVKHDRLDLSAFNGKAYTLTDSGTGAYLKLGNGETITFTGVSVSSLLASGDFNPATKQHQGSGYVGKV